MIRAIHLTITYFSLSCIVLANDIEVTVTQSDDDNKLFDVRIDNVCNKDIYIIDPKSQYARDDLVIEIEDSEFLTRFVLKGIDNTGPIPWIMIPFGGSFTVRVDFNQEEWALQSKQKSLDYNNHMQTRLVVHYDGRPPQFATEWELNFVTREVSSQPINIQRIDLN